MADWKIYTTAQDPEIFWKNEADRSYLTPLVGQENLASLFTNLQTKTYLASNGKTTFPFTVNEREYGQCYLCSLYDHYVTYAQQEIANRKNSWGWKAAQLLLAPLSLLLKQARINQAVMVNNWLFSTNLYAQESNEDLIALRDVLRHQFPKHAIIFRSLDKRCHQDKLDAFKRAGSHLLPLRMVYYVEGTCSKVFETRIHLSDKKLAQHSGYTFEMLDKDVEVSFERMCALYNMLYIEKYSSLNLTITPAFLEHALKSGKIHFGVLKKEGKIDGMVGYYKENGIMTAPYFGYDTCLPAELRLYRVLAYHLLERARIEGLLFNQSAGAGEFKKIRRAVPSLEYLTVDVSHLPLSRQVPWKTFMGVMSTFGEKIMGQW